MPTLGENESSGHFHELRRAMEEMSIQIGLLERAVSNKSRVEGSVPIESDLALVGKYDTRDSDYRGSITFSSSGY